MPDGQDCNLGGRKFPLEKTYKEVQRMGDGIVTIYTRRPEEAKRLQPWEGANTGSHGR